MVMGANPMIPGDIIGVPGPPIKGKQLKELLQGLRINAARPPVQTTHNRDIAVNYPDLSNVTHVFVKRGKTVPLGPSFDGPFEIVERLGKACIKLKVGVFASGEDRFEVQHWHNVKPAVMGEHDSAAERPALGRKPLDPQAKSFAPTVPFTGTHCRPPPPFSNEQL